MNGPRIGIPSPQFHEPWPRFGLLYHEVLPGVFQLPAHSTAVACLDKKFCVIPFLQVIVKPRSKPSIKLHSVKINPNVMQVGSTNNQALPSAIWYD
jgi:hypothetical protein